VPTDLVRNARARKEVLELLRKREPESTQPLTALLRPDAQHHVKVWVTRTFDGKIGGLLISVRYCLDRWYATLLVDDLSCAREIADVLDRSNVWSVVGPADGVEAVLAHSRRARGSVRLWFYAIPPQPPEPAAAGFDPNPSVAVRMARPDDVDALVQLYAFDEHNGAVPKRRLRHVVAGRVPYTLVAEEGGRILGAMAIPDGGAYRLFDVLIVDPAARGKGIGLALLIAAGTEAVVAGRGVCGLRAMSNGLRVSHDDVLAIGDATLWAAADLRPPTKFRGQGRLRKLVERLDGGPVTPPKPEPSPYSVLPDQRDTAAANDGGPDTTKGR
jgi:GNAT superfamily N-acetyltransferase